ncbi:hypothetical protein [Erysipelothrix rhusiopathiae]|uniref:hypothetical protein n=1 Tax=Erysipelothrix rhusiopathiae TaxID=1648 RepID=UPI000210B4EB|nr:hypothetical protein [Erysipelothrix rhusiopathiae]MDE8283151.1 hypothetical protein [Erysipelothrix rhusiopathiae]MDV7682900.1 hypothetical protein [Erysipelothrix rhusiopathiae]QDE02430.1 hypothetical protein AB984_00636 [Erysipelothrix rhusiopathiae]QDE04112.1 hypothetical protein AB985_00643 [Erysipelothrix rhusiopathiae]STD01611.1 Uncharacterised protein [Erysipelothrix rhusiopathiae]
MENILNQILNELKSINERLASIESSTDAINIDSYNFMNYNELTSISNNVRDISDKIK